MNKIPVYLVTGFLGSGKTTFIKQSIEFLSPRHKVAVVQNEFAPANFDGQELKRLTNSDFDLLEVNNGSVFCLCLLSGFIQSMAAFVKQYSPDVILLESSGLSDPVSVGQMMEAPALKDDLFLAGSISLVDAGAFLKMDRLVQRITHQVMIADFVLINKIDLPHDRHAIYEKIRKLNPYAALYETQYAQAPLNELFGVSSEKIRANQVLFFQGDSGRPDVQSAVLRTSKALRSEQLTAFLEEVAPLALRLKGYVRLSDGQAFAIQSVAGQFSTEKLESDIRQTELIGMGEGLRVRTLKNAYEQFC